MSDLRKFESGGIRDTAEGKFEYDGFLHPLVIEKFAEYMHKHRQLPDGSMRNSDNWWNLFGDDHKNICMQSAMRHMMDLWKENRGYESRDGIHEALGGLMFNTMAYWLKVIEDEKRNTTN